MGVFLSLAFVVAVLGVAIWQVLNNLIYICGPNEALVFSGGNFGKRGYRIVKGGRALRIPFLEEVDRLDLTNMNIEVKVRGGFSRGGIPLNIDGIANVKIAGAAPGLDNALERLLGKPRPLIMRIAKETLEGYLRGVLATLTPEEVNENTQAFEKALRAQAGEGLEYLGITLDNLKIQAVSDDQGYLTAMGRIQMAELNQGNRIAEAERRSESLIKQSIARQKGELARIMGAFQKNKAEAARRVANAETAGNAWVAEQKGEVQALLTRARAELDLQDARIEQMRHQLNANIVAPAKASMEAQIAQARGDAAPILENGRAQAEALRDLAKQWQAAGSSAKDIFMLQKLETILPTFLDSISRVKVDNITMLQGMGGENNFAGKAVSTVKALEAGGVDVGGLLSRLGGGLSGGTGGGSQASLQPPSGSSSSRSSSSRSSSSSRPSAPPPQAPPPAQPFQPMQIRPSTGRRSR
mgnify:CR=1 FL=1